MKYFVIAEKPSLYELFVNEGLLSKENSDPYFTVGFSSFGLPTPRELSFSDIPFSCVKWKPTFTPQIQPKKFCSVYTGIKDSEDFSQRFSVNAQKYSEIIVLVDPDHTGAWIGVNMLQLLGKTDTPISIVNITHGVDSESINRSWRDREDLANSADLFKSNYLQAKIKYTFDYLWRINSRFVFGELCKWACVDSTNPISKYEVMLLKIIAANHTGLSEAATIRKMQNWKGTGKHDNHYDVGIGSPASRSSIVEQLMTRGLIIIDSSNKTLGITKKGEQFLSYLHPKSFDPDLPFRIREWMENHDYGQLTTYINRYFGRQLRYQRGAKLVQ